MYCQKCGAENPDNGGFCAKCGERLVSGNATGVQAVVQSPKKKGGIGKIIAIIAIPVFFVAIIGILVAIGNNTIAKQNDPETADPTGEIDYSTPVVDFSSFIDPDTNLFITADQIIERYGTPVKESDGDFSYPEIGLFFSFNRSGQVYSVKWEGSVIPCDSEQLRKAFGFESFSMYNGENHRAFESTLEKLDENNITYSSAKNVYEYVFSSNNFGDYTIATIDIIYDSGVPGVLMFSVIAMDALLS